MDETRSTLLQRLADGDDSEAWQIFDKLYRPMLVGYGVSRGLVQADSEDVAQQCVQQVIKHISGYQHRDPGSFKAWLRTIAENKICDLHRARKEHQAASGIMSNAQDPAPTPDQAWEQHWLIQHLRYSVEQIRPDIAEHTYWAFYHTVIDGDAPQTVAERLAISVNQVYVAKYRVLERIRSALNELTGLDIVGPTP
jgi:RNA polymerase sigma factor (sigma-70 family)